MSDFARARLTPGSTLHLKHPNRRFPQTHTIASSRPTGDHGHSSGRGRGGGSASGGSSGSGLTGLTGLGGGDDWLVRLSGCATREDAAAFRGHAAFVWSAGRGVDLER